MSEKKNEYEKNLLLSEPKKTITNLFKWFDKTSYANNVDIADMSIKEQIRNLDVLDLICYMLNAKKMVKRVKCEFENEFFEGDSKSGKYFIWGSTDVSENLENIINISISDKFEYISEYCESEPPQNYADKFLSHVNINEINMYKGSFSYTGVINEESPFGTAPLDMMTLYNEVEINFIGGNEPAWKKYIADSYKLFDGGAYKLAFLNAFIGLDSLIELLNDTLKEWYLYRENEMIDYEFKNYNSESCTAITVMRDRILKSESYARLVKLENPYRKLIKEKLITILKYTNDWGKSRCNNYVLKLSFFEDIRNSLAHGNDYNKEYIKKKSFYNIYTDGNDSLSFSLLYTDLIFSIDKLIEELIMGDSGLCQ